MADKANHHFIPQFYLRNFSIAGDRRKAKIFCFDRSTRKSFETLVRNVGSRRHFFRINVEGESPNHIEDWMAEIESEISPHLADVIETKSFPSDAHFSSVMLLMGNMAVRNPRFRSNIENFHLKIISGMMNMMLQDQHRFEESVSQARAKGVPIRDDIEYKDMKEFITRGEYRMAIDQTYLIGLELDMVPTVVEQLANRIWSFVSTSSGTTYATCDDPIVLAWADGNEQRPYSPGFGLEGTIVMFPIAPTLALIGLFNQQPAQREYRRDQVAAMNTSIARNATKQLFGRDGSFELHTRTKLYVQGKDLVASMEQQARGR